MAAFLKGLSDWVVAKQIIVKTLTSKTLHKYTISAQKFNRGALQGGPFGVNRMMVQVIRG